MPSSSLRSLRVFFDLDREIEAAFAALIHEPWGRVDVPQSWQPAVDLYETDVAYVLEADLPGVSRDDIELSITDQRVVLRGHRRSVRVSQSERGVRIERARGDFERAVTLTQPVDPERVEVNCDQGILRIKLPKRDPQH